MKLITGTIEITIRDIRGVFPWLIYASWGSTKIAANKSGTPMRYRISAVLTSSNSYIDRFTAFGEAQGDLRQ